MSSISNWTPSSTNGRRRLGIHQCHGGFRDVPGSWPPGETWWPRDQFIVSEANTTIHPMKEPGSSKLTMIDDVLGYVLLLGAAVQCGALVAAVFYAAFTFAPRATLVVLAVLVTLILWHLLRKRRWGNVQLKVPEHPLALGEQFVSELRLVGGESTPEAEATLNLLCTKYVEVGVDGGCSTQILLETPCPASSPTTDAWFAADFEVVIPVNGSPSHPYVDRIEWWLVLTIRAPRRPKYNKRYSINVLPLYQLPTGRSVR